MKKLIKLYLLLSLLVFLVAPFTVEAQSNNVEFQNEITPPPPPPADTSGDNTLTGRLKNVGGSAGYTTDEAIASTPRIVGVIVGAFINFTGLTFIVLMIIAGYVWMTSNGNEEKIKKATTTIKAAIIGLIVSLSAWAIWNFIFKALIVGSQ
jgi:hypothetical protein